MAFLAAIPAAAYGAIGTAATVAGTAVSILGAEGSAQVCIGVQP